MFLPALRSKAAALGFCIATSTLPAVARSAFESPSRIFGGSAVEGCGWPSVANLGHCTGVLVHPRVVLTAAHCKPEQNLSRIQLQHDEGPKGVRAYNIEVCKSFPGFSGVFGKGNDWAYCILENEVQDIPIVPVMTECEWVEWTRGALHDTTVMVGYGLSELGSAGLKRQVRVPIRELLGDEVAAGGEGQAGCFGDSGGPAFVQLPDKSWRVMGLISYARGACGNPEYLVSVPASLAWLHRSLARHNIDITPCTDNQGVWVGGPYCSDFPLNPGQENCGMKPQLGGRTQSCTSGFFGGTAASKKGQSMLGPQGVPSKNQAPQVQAIGAQPNAAPADAAEGGEEGEDFRMGCQQGTETTGLGALLALLALAFRRRQS